MTRRDRVTETAVVLAGSLAAAVAFTWPLVLHLQTRARDLADTLFQAWTIDWVQHAIESGKNVYNANTFAPERTSLAFSDTLFGVAIPTLPLRWLGMTPIGVLNVTVILGFALSAAAAYLFVRLATGSRVAAAVAGAVYAFGPFGALATRHVHVAMRPGVPLAAAAAWWLADRARSNGRLAGPAVALAAVVAWQASVSFYPATYALVVAGLVLVVRLRSLGKRGIVAGLAGLAGGATCLVLLAIPNLDVAARDPNYRFPLETFGPLGANFGRIEPGTVIWGDLLGLGAGDSPRIPTFPGVVVLVLAVIGAVHAWRARGSARTQAIAGLALTGVGAMLAIGTAATGWRQYAPYRVLYELVPPFDALRATGRAWMIGLCGLALLAGLGGAAIVGWVRARVAVRGVAIAAVVAGVLVGLVMLEGFDPWFDRPGVTISAVDRELARRTDSGGVVYLPMNPSDQLDVTYFSQPANLYGATAHHRIMPNGYAGYLPPSYLRNSKRLRSLPGPAALALLQELGVRYVVVHPDVAGTPWAKLVDPATAAPLELVGRFGNDLLYEVPPS
jgi:hypothetical protein